MTKPAIDRAVAELLTSIGFRQEPPIDPAMLAQMLGISVEEARMIEDGRLEVGDGSVHLFVRVGLSEARRRFTIGHEIGHLLLMDRNEGTVARRLRSVRTDTERLCDEIAAALLMPSEWVRRRFGERTRNLSSIRQLAHTTGTSLSAATARLNELLDWRVALLRWRKDANRWRFIAGSGVPPWLHGNIRSAPETSAVLDALEAKTRRDAQASLPLLVFDGVTELPAQVSVRGMSAVALVDLKSAGSQLARAARDHAARSSDQSHPPTPASSKAPGSRAW